MRSGIVAAVAAIIFCFAVNSVITRFLVISTLSSPFALTVIRFVSGYIVLFVLGLFMPANFHKSSPKRSYIVSASFLGSYAFLISYGYLYISAAAGTLTFYSVTLITMTLLSFLEDREKVIRHRIIGLLLAFFGVVVITISGIESGGASSVTPLGVLLLAATGLSWGLYSIYGRRFPNPFSYTYYSFLVLAIGALLMTTVVIFTGGTPLYIDVSLAGLGLAMYMGTISTALSYVLWSRLLKAIKGYQGGVVQMLIPVVAGILGVALLHETVTILLLIGGAMILAGIFLNAI